MWSDSPFIPPCYLFKFLLSFQNTDSKETEKVNSPSPQWPYFNDPIHIYPHEMWGIISCYWNISFIGWLLHYKFVSVGFLVLLSLWRSLNKSTFWDISFFSVFLLRPAQLLLDSRHSHNLSWLILARRWLLRWRWNVFGLRRGCRHHALICRWSEVWALKKATRFGVEANGIAEKAFIWTLGHQVLVSILNVWPWASPSSFSWQLSVCQVMC